MLDLVLGKPCWLSTLNYRVCSICLSFLFIVYNTKLQHGDPDVRITLLRYFQAITKQKKGTSALFNFDLVLDWIDNLQRSRKLSARLLWKGERHFIQHNTGKWSLTNLPSDFLISHQSKVVRSVVFQNG